MIKYIVRRLLMMIPILMGISLIVLIFINLAPGDPARIILGDDASEEEVQTLRDNFGLNDAFHVRYIRFLSNAIRGDFGRSYLNNRIIRDEMFQRLRYTVVIAVLSTLIAVVIGVPLGIYAATHQYTLRDNAAIAISLICVSVPSFWLALLLVQLFSIKLNWLPIAGVDTWKGWVLPILSLGVGHSAMITRMMRSNLLEVISQDYITTARAKGQTEFIVLYRHALKNAIIPIVMIVASMFGMSLGGAMIAETIYSVPGVGSYMLSGLTGRDYPVIQATSFFMSMISSFVVLFIDIAFAFIDPRIRSQYTKKRERKKIEVGGTAQ